VFTLPRRPQWQDRAACNGGADPVFFPEHESWARAKEVDEKYCRTCPVRVACLGWALKMREHGIWAGMTEDQRRTLIRSRDRKKCPVCTCETLVSVENENHDICTACGLSWPTPSRHGEHDARDDDQ
jgi:WhiB family redox-sensing transcriptional regulator